MSLNSIPRQSPESQGISSKAIENLIGAFDAAGLDLHSLMIVRHGNVVSESWWAPYAADRKHMLFSLSKSFTSTAAGFAVQEGLIRLDDKVIQFFPDRLPAYVSEHLAAMTVRDLLTMSTGHEKEPFVYGNDDWAKGFLSAEVPHLPGTHFVYNTAATYMVAAILKVVTKQDLVEYLRPRLFDPIGIDGEAWEHCPLGVRTGGFGLSIRTEEIAKFGIFLAQKGNWEGKQLLNSEWIELATSKVVENGPDPDNDWNQGYGFQFWRCRNGAYRGDGAFGQFCIVHPELDLVVAITSGVSEMGRVLNLIWDGLLPHVHRDPLPENSDSVRHLVARSAALELRAPLPQEDFVEMPREKFVFEGENALNITAIQIEEHHEAVRLKIEVGPLTHDIIAHFDQWMVEGTTDFQSPGPLRYGEKAPAVYAAKAAWTTSNELSIRVAYVETPFAPWITLRLSEEDCAFRFAGPISLIESGDRPEILGRRV